MKRSKLATLTGFLVAAALIAGGCGSDSDDTSGGTDETSSSTADAATAADIETTLESSLESSGVSDVACPDDAEIAADSTFTCDLTGKAGATGSVDVTIEDDTGSDLSYKGSIDNDGYTTTLKGSVKSA